ncbi:MAG: alpha/beta fold hydrolase BchO, partial [Ahrensia sp.]
SRFVQSGDLLWHCQRGGPASAEKLLLLHGTGASTHSYRDAFATLIQDYDVLAIDLPGHGFTQTAPSAKLSLPGMAKAVATLLANLSFEPTAAVGHSAGAAILLQMALTGAITPNVIIGLNAALKPIEGNAFLAPLAKMLFINPLTPRLFAMQARYTQSADTLLAATNSDIDAAARANYRALMANPAHVNGALGMMANWDLKPLIENLGALQTDVRLVVARDDKMVPPDVSRETVKRLRNSRLIEHETGGHLLHEISPNVIAAALNADPASNSNAPTAPTAPAPSLQRAAQ